MEIKAMLKNQITVTSMFLQLNILCFDLNSGQITFKLKKFNNQGHRPADHAPNMRVI